MEDSTITQITITSADAQEGKVSLTIGGETVEILLPYKNMDHYIEDSIRRITKLTPRDMFAKSAMRSLLAGSRAEYEWVAERAYEMADQMMLVKTRI
jgi:hypothetical protein